MCDVHVHVWIDSDISANLTELDLTRQKYDMNQA